MKVQNIIPGAEIAPYVDRILVIENNVLVAPFVLPLYANGVPTLLYLSAKGRLGNGDSNYLTLFGQTISPESLQLTQDFLLIAYFFKPHALISLFGIPALELTDKPIDLNLLSPQKTIPLQDRLLNCVDLAERITCLDKYISGLVAAAKGIPETVKYASEKIARDYSKESLRHVQGALNMSERTFQRMFDEHIGISPNTYRRICQFNAAFTDLNLGKFTKLSDIAFSHGYTDQSHYIRAFKEFTQINPTEYLNYGTG